jgi:hypothetical protein
MGHRNSEMIIKVHGKFIADVKGTAEGSVFGEAFHKTVCDEISIGKWVYGTIMAKT